MSKCKGENCGAEIVWADLVDADGKPVKKGGQSVRVPMDSKPPIYLFVKPGVVMRAEARFMVSHFSTCPDANDFSGTNKGKQQ